jgi:DNA-binding transcriptional LysR family regulator
MPYPPQVKIGGISGIGATPSKDFCGTGKDTKVDYLDGLRAFVRTVELGSFSKAAAESGAKISTLSRYVAALEEDLGAALLQRSTRRLRMTEAGEILYKRAVRILEDLDAARLTVSALSDAPRGVLRINVPTAFGRRHVVSHLPRFLEQYPDISIDATLTDQTVDLIEAGADVAVRIGALADSTLVAKRLAPQRRALCAGPDFLRNVSPISSPLALAAMPCIEFALQPSRNWYFRKDSTNEQLAVAVHGPLRINNSEAILDAVRLGVGVALLPTWLIYEALQNREVQRVLPDWDAAISPGPERAIWGVYPSNRIESPKVKAFLAFLQHQFGRPPYWDCAELASVAA